MAPAQQAKNLAPNCVCLHNNVKTAELKEIQGSWLIELLHQHWHDGACAAGEESFRQAAKACGGRGTFWIACIAGGRHGCTDVDDARKPADVGWQ